MINGITKANLMHTAPSVLVKDEGMNPMVNTLADALAKLAAKCRMATIYPRIDQLPEDLLDILAKDFKVDWYDFNYSLATKRKVLKDSFYVHRHMGTRAAVEKAISDVWPDSVLEEWFEYGGNPFMFRVVLNATDGSNPIPLDTALNKIRIYKPVRAHLESEIPIVRVVFNVIVQTEGKSSLYHVPVTGTIPRIASHGSMDDNGMVLGTQSGSAVYSVRRCGTPSSAL